MTIIDVKNASIHLVVSTSLVTGLVPGVIEVPPKHTREQKSAFSKGDEQGYLLLVSKLWMNEELMDSVSGVTD